MVHSNMVARTVVAAGILRAMHGRCRAFVAGWHDIIYDTGRRRPAPGASGADDLAATDCTVEVVDRIKPAASPVYSKRG